MFIYLIKKDLLLVKKHLLYIFAIAIIIPVFYSWRAPALLGFFSILSSVLLVEVLLIGNVLTEEEKYPKAEMLLCVSPYTRKTMIFEKYILIFAVFICCCIIYNFLALFLNNMKLLNFNQVINILFINSVIFSFFMPLQYKMGIQKTKMILSLGAFGIPLILTSVKLYLANLFENINYLNLSDNIICVLQIFAILIIGSTSFFTSYKIYLHKEL